VATTGTAIWPGATTLPGAGTIPGQGTAPIVRVRYSTDDVSDSTPSWTEVANTKFRSFSISRGRESELSAFDAGSTTVRVDNRNRTFDPNLNASIRPLNRWWIYSEFAGEVHTLFKGYAESYALEWPDGGWSEAVSTVSLVDEFKVLTLGVTPTTSPPRDSYEDLVASDNPSGYWRLNEAPELRIQPAEVTDPNPSPPWGGGGAPRTPPHGKGWT
jgi:hypothetical protein